jgi:hypothetical protein
MACLGTEGCFMSLRLLKDFYVLKTLGKKGLSPAGVGNGRARWSPRCHSVLLRLTVSISHLSRPLQLPLPPFGQLPCPGLRPSTRCPFCPPPAGARPPVCLILPPLRSGTIIRPIRRVAARRPPIVGLPRAARPGTWRRWRAG